MMKKLISVLMIMTFVGVNCSMLVSAGYKVPVNDGKQIIFMRDDKASDGYETEGERGGATYTHDGSVSYDKDDNLYYMKGWSIAKGSSGADLYHYTTADFANAFGLNSFGAATKWGTGKVWATSEGVGWEVYDSTYGRIRYGL